MKDSQAELIAQYLRIIDMQQTEINVLKTEKRRLLNSNHNLRKQKVLYKESALEWKRRFEEYDSNSSEGGLILDNVKKALDIYRDMQGL